MGALIRFLVVAGAKLADIGINIWLLSELLSDEPSLEEQLAKMAEEYELQEEPLAHILKPANDVIEDNLIEYQKFAESIRMKMLLCKFYLSVISPKTITDHLTAQELEYALYSKLTEKYGVITLHGQSHFTHEQQIANVLYYIIPFDSRYSESTILPLEFLNPDADYDRERFDNVEQYILDDIKRKGNKKLDKTFTKAKAKNKKETYIETGLIVLGISGFLYYAYKHM